MEAIRYRRPLHPSTTDQLPEGIVKKVPSRRTGMSGEAKRRHGEIGRKVHQRRNQRLADRDAQQQESKGKGERPGDLASASAMTAAGIIATIAYCWTTCT